MILGKETSMERIPVRQVSALWPLLGILTLTFAVNVPFLNQAFHMDDGIYLLLSQNVRQSPWFPEDEPAYFEGLCTKDLASTEHPWPFTIYLLALSSFISGDVSEMRLHFPFLVFPLAISCSMYFLGRRFTGHPIFATLLVVTMPVLYVMSHTLMTDVPLLALWLSATAVFCSGVDRNRMTLDVAGTVLVTIACFLSYSGFCLIPLLGLYGILKKDRGGVVTILICPILAFSIRLAAGYIHYRRFIPGMLLNSYFLFERVLSPASVFQKSIFTILVLGMVAAVPCLVLAIHRKRLLLICCLLAVPIALILKVPGYDPFQKVLFAMLFCPGIAALCLGIQDLWKALRFLRTKNTSHADDFFLGAWFLGFFVFCSAAYMNGSARYVLPAVPAVVLILLRHMERVLTKKAVLWSCWGGVILSSTLAIAMAVADFQFAAIYRNFTAEFKKVMGGRKSQVWFTGEWGLRAYLERLGGQELGRCDARPLPGDLLVVPTLATPYETLYSDKLRLQSTILIAPSRVAFDIPVVHAESELIFTAGMPFHETSDGLEYSVRFVSRHLDRVLVREVLMPAQGRQWKMQRLSLRDVAGENGSIIFSADVGSSGNADADWLAIAQARISNRGENNEIVLYDFAGHLADARIERVPGFQYQTDQNNPVFPMTVRLAQVPAVKRLAHYNYSPDFPLRLLGAGPAAGFWSSGWGLLPFSFAPPGSVLESISVYEATRAADGFGQTNLSWYLQ